MKYYLIRNLDDHHVNAASEQTFELIYKKHTTLTGRVIQGSIEAVMGTPSQINVFMQKIRDERK